MSSLLTENEALILTRSFGQMPPEDQAVARVKMQAYESDRHANGKPLFPTWEAQTQKRRDDTEGWWLDNREPDYVTAGYSDAPDLKPGARRLELLGQLTGTDPRTIAASPGAWRVRVAQAWGVPDAATDDALFDSEATKQISKQRNFRHLVQGNGREDEESKPLNEGALMNHAALAAKDGKNAAAGFSEWQAAAKARPEYAAAEGRDLFEIYSGIHAQAAENFQGLKGKAEKIFGILQREMSNGQPFADTSEAETLIEGLSPAERSMIGELVGKQAEKLKAGEGKGTGQKSGETVGRVFGRLLESQGSAGAVASLSALDAVGGFVEGQSVPADLAGNPAKLIARQATNAMTAAAGGNAAAVELFQDRATLTAEQAAAANAEIAKQRRSLNARKYLMDLAEGTVDPVKADSIAGRFGLGSLNVGASMLSFAMPGGAVANTVAYVEDERARLENQGIDPGTAAAQSVVVGGAQAALDKLELSIFKRLPKTGITLNGFLTPSASVVGSVGKRAITSGLPTAAFETGIEVVQDTTPLIVQKTLSALGADEPAVSWDQIGKEAWATSEEMFFSMLPLAMLGAGVGGHADYKAARAMVSDTQALEALGFSPEQVGRITGPEATEDRVKLLQGLWKERTPVVSVARDANEQAVNDALNAPGPVSQVAAAAGARADLNVADSLAQKRADFQAEMAGLDERGFSLTRRQDVNGKAEWVVKDREAGTETSHVNFVSAYTQAKGKIAGLDLDQAEAISTVADFFLNQNREGVQESLTITGEVQTAFDRLSSGVDPELMAERVRIEERRRGVAEGSLLSAAVLGENVTTFNSIVGDGVKRVVAASQSKVNVGANVLTAIEEIIEGRQKAMAGVDPAAARARDLAFVRLAEQATGESFLGSKDDAAVSALDLTEAISHVVQAEVLNRRKNGGKFAAAGHAVSRGLESFGGQAKEALGLKTFLAAMRALFAAIFKTAAKLSKAQREGKLGEDFSGYVDNLLGLSEQKAHNQAVVEGLDALDLTPGPLGSMSLGVASVTTEGQKRARAGGEIGPNGDWYPGGAFIATTDMPKKLRQKLEKMGDKPNGIQVANREFQQRESGMFSPYQRLVGSAIGPDGRLNEDYLSNSYNKLPAEFVEQVRIFAERFRSGERQFAVNEFPALVDGSTIAQMLLNGEAVPGAVIDSQPWAREMVQKFESPAKPKDSISFSLAGASDLNLVTVHNLSVPNLRHALDVGGLPVPSIASADPVPGPLGSMSLGGAAIASDAEYLKAVESGDMAEAQRMVDEAARAAGYTEKAFHGTPSKAFTVFDLSRAGATTDEGFAGKGFYFHIDQDTAKVYGRVIDAWLKLQNPYDFDGENFATVVEKHGGPSKFSDWLRANGYDGAELWGQRMVLDPNQIKSADPVTRDASGAVIPLSQRFDSTKDSISFSLGGASAELPAFRRDALETARAMAAAGKSSEEIRALTGWFPGKYDGKMRWEIPDQDAKLLPIFSELRGGGWEAGKMTSIDYAPGKDGKWDVVLFPENAQKSEDILTLKGVDAEFLRSFVPDQLIARMRQGEGKETFIGSDFRSAKTIKESFDFDGFNALPVSMVLDHPLLFKAYPEVGDVFVTVDASVFSGGSFGRNTDKQPIITVGRQFQLSTLLHEIQHWIQDKEDFARGSSPAAITNLDAKTAEQMTEVETELRTAIRLRDSGEFLYEGLSLAQIIDAKTFDDAEVKRWAINLANAGDVEINRFFKDTPNGQYRRAAGEIEARDVQARQKFTDEQRAAVAPYSSENIAAQDGIVLGMKSFSIASADYLSAVAAMLDRAASDPVARLATFQRAAGQLAGMSRAVRFNDQNAIRNLSRAGLETERARIQSRRTEELYQAIDNETPHLQEAVFVSAMQNNPLINLISTPVAGGKRFKSRLISAKQLRKQGRIVGGEYDGSADLPGFLFGGKESVDTLAQEAYENGLIRDPSADAFWRGIEQALTASSKGQEMLSRYKEQRREARDVARSEANAWAEKQAKAQAGIDFERRELGRAMAALDTMLLAFPPEVRAMVGGFTKLADLQGNKARLSFFKDRVEKLAAAMEVHLQREYRKELNRLIEQARPKGAKEKGAKIVGKIGAAAHAWFAQIEPMLSMSGEQVAERLNAIELALAEDLTPQRQDELTTEWSLLHVFGDFRNKSALEMSSAFSDAQTIYETGRTGWVAVMEQRRTDREGFRGQAIDSLGGKATRRKQDAGAARRRTKAGAVSAAIGGFARNLLSFRQVVADIFGRGSAAETRYDRMTRDATRAERAARLRRERDFELALNDIYGTRNRLQRQRVLYDLVQPVENSGVIFRDTTTRDLPIEIDVAERIVNGEMGQAEHGLRPYEVTELRWLLDDHYDRVAKDLPGARRSVLHLPRVARGKEHNKTLSRAQAMKLWLTYQMDEYKPSLARDGVDGITMEQIEAFLSPADLQLMAWMGEQYENGYEELNAPFRRLYGVNLPQVKNYAPGTFQTSGNQAVNLPGEQANGGAGSMSSGFLKKRKKHVAAIDLSNESGAIGDYWQHVTVTEHWIAWAEAVDEMKSVFFNVDVNEAVKAEAGASAALTLRTWVDTHENDGVRQSYQNLEMRKWLSAMMGARAKVSLGWKVGVWLKQATAAFGALLDLSSRDFAASAARVLQGSAVLRYQDAATLPVMAQRLASGGSPEIRMVLSGGAGSYFRPGVAGEFMQTGMDAINAIDGRFTMFSAAVAYDAHFRSAIRAGLTPEEARAAAADRTDLTLAKTAQPVETLDKSLFEISMPVAVKPFFMFMSEARKSVALEIAAVAQAMRGQGSWLEAGKILAVNHFVFGSMTWALGAMWRDLMNDDDDTGDDPAWELKDWLLAISTGPLSGIPVLGDVLQTALARMTNSFLPSHEANLLEGNLSDLSKGVAAIMADPPEGEELEHYVKKSGATVRAMAQMIGGEFAALGVASNVVEQVFNLGDDFIETSGERETKLLKKADALEKEADQAKFDALTSEQVAAAEVEKERKKAERRAKRLREVGQ